MESVLAAIVSVALILLAALTASQGTLSSASLLSESWKAMEERSGEISRTAIGVTNARAMSGGSYVRADISNQGAVSLTDFDQWDVIVQYYRGGNYYVLRAPYTSDYPPGANQWSIEWIRVTETGTDEVYEPGILNPGEQMRIRVSVSPSVGSGTTNQITVATPNGVATSVIFTY